MGYSPLGHKESDMSESLTLHWNMYTNTVYMFIHILCVYTPMYTFKHT